MGQLYFPTKKSIKGPWLLSKDDFEELDKIVAKADEYLLKSLEIEIRETVLSETEKENLSESALEEEIKKAKSRYSFEKKSKSFLLISKGETRLRDESIKGLLKDKSIQSLKPKEFYLYIEYGYNNTLRLEVANKYDGDLTYDLKCYDPNLQSEIQFELDKWIEKRKPSSYIQFWSNWGGVFTIMFFFILIGLGPFIFLKTYENYNQQLVNQSNELLKNGISDGNRDKAIELLLKIETDYSPQNFTPKVRPQNPIFVRCIS